MDILQNMANSGDPLKGQLTQGHATPTPVTARSTGGVGAPPVLKSERECGDRTQFMVQQVIAGQNEGAADKWLTQREKRHRERAEKLRESLKQKLILEKQMQLLAGKSLDINNNNLLDFTALPSKKSFGSSDVMGLRERSLMDSLGKLTGDGETTDERKLSGPSAFLLPPLPDTLRKISEPTFIHSSTAAQPKHKKISLQSRESFIPTWREQSQLNLQKRQQSQSLDTMPQVSSSPWASNSTLPTADRALPPKKLYPDNARGTSSRKYAINFCHLTDAPLSFANHYLQERNKEQLDYRTICSFWLQHLEHFEQFYQINESLSLHSPQEEIYDETWDEL